MAQRSTPRPSLEGTNAGTNGSVSWLEADPLSLPSAETPVGTALRRSGSKDSLRNRRSLLQWRGRAGFTPASK